MTRPNEAPVVLIVEDEWLLRDTLAIHLRGAGCTVIEASSGERALSRLSETRDIDAVVTAIRLGGAVNGWDVGEAARAGRKEIAIMDASGQPIRPRMDDGKTALEKPYDLDAILCACQGRRQSRAAYSVF